MSDTTESQLVLQAQAGDRQALGDLLSLHRETIFAMAMRILHNRADAADATQETLLRVVRHMGRFDADRPIRPWLRTIAIRAALDQAKRTGRHPVAQVDPDATADARPDPHKSASGAELASRVQQALSRLSPAQRAVFVCKELEDMDTKEIARSMGVKKATVRWHLYEAKKRLASALATVLTDRSAP